ncbi:hypothetical protein Fmac_011243 [Flemingia macrophylla]|uniref:Uncharacterized protein n=1 Tax=Flemingia macrophylla TaxID=520843 RepID=A0ABD1MMP2_9FABA
MKNKRNLKVNKEEDLGCSWTNQTLYLTPNCLLTAKSNLNELKPIKIDSKLNW